MIIYSVGYSWENIKSKDIHLIEYITLNFNEILEFIKNNKQDLKWIIKKWLNGKVIAEYVVNKNTIEPVEIN